MQRAGQDYHKQLPRPAETNLEETVHEPNSNSQNLIRAWISPADRRVFLQHLKLPANIERQQADKINQWMRSSKVIYDRGAWTNKEPGRGR